MKTRIILLMSALVMLAVPVFAGSGEKCATSTQVCVNHWAAGKDKGWTGLELDKSEVGIVKVKSVTPDSPAAAAGFQIGDVLVAMNGVKMADKEGMKKAKGTWKAGQSVSYTVQRAGAEQQIAVTLARTPDQIYSSMMGSHMIENHAVVATASAEGKSSGSDSKK
jgi:S1-C subfamily serine protease